MHWTSQQCKTYQYTNLLSLQWAASILLNVPSGHIYGCILPNTPPPPPKRLWKLVNALSLCHCFLLLGKDINFHLKKKPLHFLSSRTYCAKLNKIKIWNVRPTDRRRSNSPSGAQVSYPPIQKKPQNPPITSTPW